MVLLREFSQSRWAKIRENQDGWDYFTFWSTWWLFEYPIIINAPVSDFAEKAQTYVFSSF